MSFKVVIAGTRHFNDYKLLQETADFVLSKQTDVEIVSGGCRGADKLGERYAKERGHKVRIFNADWGLGNFAGPMRNVEMAVYADGLIAFWDGKSKGTAHMIETAKKLRKKVKVVVYGKKVKEKQ
jgi:hypothetical protein